MTFSRFDFDPRLQAGIAAAGYVHPTPIQLAAIPEILAGKDVLGVAQTGTGKTAAFALPIMHRLLTGPRRRVRALILAPTRELAEQTTQEIRGWARQTDLRTAAIYGGVGKPQQVERLRAGAEIVSACPGRLLDLYADGDLDLSHVEVLVLDEADRLFDMGFLPSVRRILAALPRNRQNLMFSATMPPEVRSLADAVLVHPAVVSLGTPAPAPTISHVLYPVSGMHKGALLSEILERSRGERTLIFTRTKYRARNLTKVLARERHRVARLEGNMSQGQRQEAIDGFRAGRYDILVATDIAARGIDVIGIATVVNFDMPDTFDAYTHRVGRTGRALRTGEAVSFVSAEDTALVRAIQDQRDAPLEQRILAGFDYGDFTPRLLIVPRQIAASATAKPGGGIGGRRGGARRRAPRWT